jgi:Fur family transcriptional regulator, ferric uptake regulator
MQRATQQKAAISRALLESGRPLSVSELLESSRKIVPSVSIATVYRNINALTEAGQIVAVALPGEPPRYEMANLGDHHHFKCNDCDRVFNVEPCEVKFDHAVPKGYRVDSVDVTLYGACAECA